MNLLIFGGRLGKDPEIKTFASGDAYCNLSVPHSESWTDAQGQKKEKTEWMNCFLSGKQAENAAKYLRKGDYVTCYGKFETREYTDKDGFKKTAWQMKTERIEFGPKGQANQRQESDRQVADINIPQNEPRTRETFSAPSRSDSVFDQYSKDPGSLDDIPF